MKNKKKLACLRGQRTALVTAIESQLSSAKELLEIKNCKSEDFDEIAEEVGCQVELLIESKKQFEDLTIQIAEENDGEDAESQNNDDGVSSMDTGIAVTRTVTKLKGRLAKLKIGLQAINSEEEENSPYGKMKHQIDALIQAEQHRSPGILERRSSLFGRSSQIRLPKIQFASFNGDLLKWPEFWDSFEAAVDRNEESLLVEKLSYLRSKLCGDAITTIEGLQTTNENYDVAVSLLKSRYGNTQLLVTTHYSQMMELPRVSNVTAKIRELHDTLEKHLRSLEALGEDTSHRHFISLVMAKLPWQVVAKLEESKDDEEQWTVSLLRKKLHSHLSARETADLQCPTKSYDNTEGISKTAYSHRQQRPRGTTETLFAGDRRSGQEFNRRGCPSTTTARAIKCIFCSGDHYNDECRRFATLESRKHAIKGRCYICLSDQHSLRFCPMKNRECAHCRQIGNHHKSLCPKKCMTFRETAAMVPEEHDEEDVGIADKALLATGENVLLQTALCSIKQGSHSLQVRVLLDSGSHRSYISEQLARNLDLKTTENESVSVVTFGSNKEKTIETRKAEVFLMASSGFSKEINVNVVPKISGNISIASIPFDENNYIWKDLPLADSFPKTTEMSSIDCLIGSDYCLDLVTNDKIQIKEGLYLLGSKFGWILTRRTGEAKAGQDVTLFINSHINGSTTLPNQNDNVDACLPVSPNVEDLWQLETIGINDNVEKTDDEEASNQFATTVTYEGSRYYVGWPQKEEYNTLPENFGLAYERFKTTCRRLSKDQSLLEKYDRIIKDQEAKGIVEKVQSENKDNTTMKHYIPHHPDVNSKKIRIVYDASAKTVKSDRSLNECLLRGPVMLQDLCGLLLRFRMHRTVLLADIEKAFLQVGLRQRDRDVTRFFGSKMATILLLRITLKFIDFAVCHSA